MLRRAEDAVKDRKRRRSGWWLLLVPPGILLAGFACTLYRPVKFLVGDTGWIIGATDTDAPAGFYRVDVLAVAAEPIQVHFMGKVYENDREIHARIVILHHRKYAVLWFHVVPSDEPPLNKQPIGEHPNR